MYMNPNLSNEEKTIHIHGHGQVSQASITPKRLEPNLTWTGDFIVK